MLTGSGYNSNPQSVLWFCHICGSSFTLHANEYHQCKPAPNGIKG